MKTCILCITVLTEHHIVSNSELHTLNSEYWAKKCCLCCFVFGSLPCIPSPLPYTLSSSASNSCYGCSEAGSVIIEGPLRRKTLLKEGRKPRVRWSLISLWLKLFLKYGSLCQQRNHLMSECSQHVHLFGVSQLSSWTRFWITLSGSTLTFYGAKALRASERKHVSLMLKEHETVHN